MSNPASRPGFGAIKIFHMFFRSRTLRYFLLGALPGLLLFASEGLCSGRNAAGIGLLDAVTITIAKQPVILLEQQQVASSRGKFQQQSGAFDTNLGAALTFGHQNNPLTPTQQFASGASSQRTDTTTTSVNLSREFRTGVTVSPSVQVIRTDTMPGPLTSPDAGTVNFTISIPLLKGLGTEAADAGELAARSDLAATILTLRHTISQEVAATASSYWDYVAAAEELELYRASEKSAQGNYSDTKKLIAGGERAAADINLVSAYLAAKTAARIQAEQSLVAARQALGLAMGLPVEKIDSLPLPTSDFTTTQNQAAREIGGAAILRRLIAEALYCRADYLASRQSVESAKILMRQAKNGLLPEVDFQMGAGYSGLNEGASITNIGGALVYNIPGASASASLTYKWPVENDTAKGIYVQTESNYRMAKISTDDLARNIGANVSLDISNLMKTALAVTRFREAVDQYIKAVEDGNKKLRLGMTTMVEQLTTADNLVAAQINLVAAQSVYAKTLVQLRYDTGTLLAGTREQFHLDLNNLTTIPFVGRNED